MQIYQPSILPENREYLHHNVLILTISMPTDLYAIILMLKVMFLYTK